MFGDTVTVFNFDKASGQWYPTVLNNVELQTKNGINEKNSGASSSDNALLFVSYSGDVVGDKDYLPPKEWRKSDDKESFVTFAEGDFFAVGEYYGVISEYDYEDGYFTYLSENYDYCYKITSVKLFKNIPHFEIGGV